MHVAGGVYREVCETPQWNGIWGSGLRAASAISRLNADVTLHCYDRQPAADTVAFLEQLGVAFKPRPRMQDIAFAYFHPLSNPFVEPPPDAIKQCKPIEIDGRSILRFGMLEGTARVRGGRVVYDPQSPRSAEPFAVNGSTARELALVMNQEEFQAYTRNDDISDGASKLLVAGDADVIVVKRGIFGALVFVKGMSAAEIPMYRSPTTFKIGTGDVFSGVFAHYWTSGSCPPQHAADQASRAVSVYCRNPTEPVDETVLSTARPLLRSSQEEIEVIGIGNTLGRRYSLQEAAYCIRKLGPAVTTIQEPKAIEEPRKTALIIADGLTDEAIAMVLESRIAGVILVEEDRPSLFARFPAGVSRDFASAVYQVCTDPRKLK